MPFVLFSVVLVNALECQEPEKEITKKWRLVHDVTCMGCAVGNSLLLWENSENTNVCVEFALKQSMNFIPTETFANFKNIMKKNENPKI